MATTKKASRQRMGALLALSALQERVATLEHGHREMRAAVGQLSEELGALRVSVRHVDERTIRGERLAHEMQKEQRAMMRLVTDIAEALEVVPTPPPSHDSLEHPDPIVAEMRRAAHIPDPDPTPNTGNHGGKLP